jgi:tRNA-Thr(GGU) m(6)t(6)A37 methyltransferase TsaA
MTRRVAPTPVSLTPIGVIRTPFADKASAPRQPALAKGARGRMELYPDGRYEHALSDLSSFDYIWALFLFHKSRGWRAKVLPPRSATRRGVFSTRAPYRPNPIGLSLLRLERIEGTVLHVVDVDMLDRTPLLDIKPYLPYADQVLVAEHGWLDEQARGREDPASRFEVSFSPRAHQQIEFLRDRCGVELASRIRTALALGPSPHPYRRIKKDGTGFRLAVQEWRVRFVVSGRSVLVEKVASGYRPSQLFTDPALATHRAFAESFGADGERIPRT